MKRLLALLLLSLLPLAGCARLAGLPDAEAQVRIWEGRADIAGGNILTPARGAAGGHGCIISEIGTPQSQVWYAGEHCRVCYRCEAAADEEPR